MVAADNELSVIDEIERVNNDCEDTYDESEACVPCSTIHESNRSCSDECEGEHEDHTTTHGEISLCGAGVEGQSKGHTCSAEQSHENNVLRIECADKANNVCLTNSEKTQQNEVQRDRTSDLLIAHQNI